MRPDPKGRLDTTGPRTPLGGLQSAFSGLNLPADLPPAPTDPEPVWKMGRVVLRREKAHRGGKTVIVVDGFATHLPLSVIEAVAKGLRVACGTGGTVAGRRVEIQGDQAAKVRAALEAQGFEVAGVR